MDAEVNSELLDLIKQLGAAVFIGGHDELINTRTFDKAAVFYLAPVSVALKVFENHIPAYSAAKHPGAQKRN